MIKQAIESDIPIIEEILLDAAQWLDSIDCSLWSAEEVKWAKLSKRYDISEFRILYVGDDPAGCVVISDYDPIFWKGIPKGESLYIHKFAIKRKFAGQGYSKILIACAKQTARERGIKSVRLDCEQYRPKLRTVYEREGFVCVKEETIYRIYDTAFYEYILE